MEENTLEYLIRRPDSLASVSESLSPDERRELLERLMARLCEDYRLTFEALADSTGRWHSLWQQASRMADELDFNLEGMPGGFNEVSICGFVFDRAVRPVWRDYDLAMPTDDRLRRTLLAVVFGIMRRGEWRKWHTVIRGIEPALMNEWLICLAQGSAETLAQTPAARFAGLMTSESDLIVLEGFIENYLESELAESCSVESAAACFRNELIQRPELSFEDRVLGLLVFVSDIAADPLSELDPVLADLHLGLDEFEKGKAWFLQGRGQRLELPVMDLAGVIATIRENEGIQAYVSQLDLRFDVVQEVIRAQLERFREHTSGATENGVLPSAITMLTSAIERARLPQVLEVLAEPLGFSGSAADFDPTRSEASPATPVDLLADRLLADEPDGGLPWLEVSLRRDTILRSIWHADDNTIRTLVDDLHPNGPDVVLAAGFTEALASASPGAKARLTLLHLGWLEGRAAPTATITPRMENTLEAMIMGDVFAFSEDWNAEAGDRRIAAAMLMRANSTVDISPQLNSQFTASCRDAWSFLHHAYDPDRPAQREPTFQALTHLVDRFMQGWLAEESRYSEADLKAAVDLGRASVIHHWADNLVLDLIPLRVRLLGWFESADNTAWAMEYAQQRSVLAEQQFLSISNSGDFRSDRSKRAAAARYLGGLQARNQVLQEIGIRADELDAWVRQLLEGSISPDEVPVAVASRETRKSRAGERVKLRNSFATLWPRAMACLVALGVIGFSVLYVSKRDFRPQSSSTVEGRTVDPVVEFQSKLQNELGLTFMDLDDQPVRLGIDSADLDSPLYSEIDAAERRDRLSVPRTVTIPDFWMSIGPVNNDQLEKFFPDPEIENFELRPAILSGQRGNLRPAVRVPYAKALAYCGMLNDYFQALYPQLFVANAKYENWRFRLPTEEEWEYAAGNGRNSPFWWGERWDQIPAEIREVAMAEKTIIELRQGDDWLNDFGLTGFHFNVAEWVISGNTTVLTPDMFSLQRIRGSAWPKENPPIWQRTAHAIQMADSANDSIGFRLVFAPSS